MLLPVLLGAGFVLGGQVLSGDDRTVDAAAARATSDPAVDAGDEPVQGPPPVTAPTPAAPPTPTAASPAAPPTPTAGPPAAPPLTGSARVFGLGQVSDDVRAWQQRMAERGWDIVVDGIYGPQTARVAALFQAESGLVVDGVVGPDTWAAAWEAPVA